MKGYKEPESLSNSWERNIDPGGPGRQAGNRSHMARNEADSVNNVKKRNALIEKRNQIIKQRNTNL
jgi:hypothetical protein